MFLKAKKVKQTLKPLLLFIRMQPDSLPSLPFSALTAQQSPWSEVGGPADWQAVTGETQSVIPDKPRLLLNVVEQWIQWLETERETRWGSLEENHLHGTGSLFSFQSIIHHAGGNGRNVTYYFLIGFCTESGFEAAAAHSKFHWPLEPFPKFSNCFVSWAAAQCWVQVTAPDKTKEPPLYENGKRSAVLSFLCYPNSETWCHSIWP